MARTGVELTRASPRPLKTCITREGKARKAEQPRTELPLRLPSRQANSFSGFPERPDTFTPFVKGGIQGGIEHKAEGE